MSDRNCEDVPLPADGEWPCQTERPQFVPPRLKAALYLLLRDYVLPGDLEQVAIDVARHTTNAGTFTNPHLEGYAESLAAYLLWEPETETGLA